MLWNDDRQKIHLAVTSELLELLVGLPSLAVNDHADVEGLMFLVEVLDADIAGADAAAWRHNSQAGKVWFGTQQTASEARL